MRGESDMLMSNSPDIYRPNPGLQAVPLPACQPPHHLVCFFFCLFLSPPRRRSRFLARSVKSWAESARDEKQTKCLLIQRPRVTALSNGITPKSQTKTTSAAGYQSQISRPLMYNINAQAKKVWTTSRLNGKAAEQTRHPRSSAFFILFSLLFFFFFRHVFYSRRYKDFQIQPTAFVLCRAL